MATSTTVQSKKDNSKWIRLPAELKEAHGDGIIMCADEDSALQNCLLGLIYDVGVLDDDSKPNVIPWETACPWVQNSVSNLETCFNYYTLVMCIITENMLQSRHFADAALLTALENHNESFIPLFKSQSDYKALAHNPKWENKLPGLYKTLKPIYLEGVNSEIIISQLKKLFNCHIDKKKLRMDNHDRKIKEAYHKMSLIEDKGKQRDPQTVLCYDRPVLRNSGDNLNLYDSNNIPAENYVEPQNINYTSLSTELINLGSIQPNDKDTVVGQHGFINFNSIILGIGIGLLLGFGFVANR